MAEDKETGPENLIPANDNINSDGDDVADADIAPWEKLDRVVLSIARLIGRQMARDAFERMQAETANDNEPSSRDDPASEGEEPE